jgi:chromodomain-helicase-DNA-binding protein 1
VNVYRFISKDSIEEDIIDRAKRKMVLEYSIISTMDTSGMSVMKKKKKGADTDKVSSEELQTILKFGAQNLFNSEEKDGIAKKNQLEEMNLDDILARAEVQEGVEQSGTALGSAEFLTQFHVSDVAQMSWDDLIPEDLREKVTEPENEIPDDFLQDSRRRTGPIDYSGKDFQIDTTKRKRKVRVSGDSTSFSDKEKRALIRALQKFGDWKRRLNDIISDAELTLKNPELVKEKLLGIIDVCEKAMKTSNVKNKTITTTFEGIIGVNAGLITQRITDLEFLNTRLSSQALSSFRITWTIKPVTNWSIQWGSKDDAMLLVGIYKHGYGCWTQMRDDPELPFQKKFFLATDDKSLPGTIHLQRRSDFLLKALREVEGRKYSKTELKFFEKKPKNPKPSRVQKPVKEVVSDYESMDESYCKETLKPVKKNLKSLATPTKYVTDKKAMATFIKENLVLVGKHIREVLQKVDKTKVEKTGKHLWKYASYFWPTDIPSLKYKALFSKMLDASVENLEVMLDLIRKRSNDLDHQLEKTHRKEGRQRESLQKMASRQEKGRDHLKEKRIEINPRNEKKLKGKNAIDLPEDLIEKNLDLRMLGKREGPDRRFGLTKYPTENRDLS